MTHVLACIDGSAYSTSVCDHAAWFASDPDVGVEVLHVLQSSKDGDSNAAPAEAGNRLIDYAVGRLREEGVGPLTAACPFGSFVDVATSRGASMIVMGKRGLGSDDQRTRLGSNVEAMVRATTTPICITSKPFLPVHRAVVLLDADMTHRAAIDFVVSHARLAVLPMDVLVVTGSNEDPDPKVQWARAALGQEGGDVFALMASGLDEAVTKYMEDRAADLVVVSRAVVAQSPGSGLRQIEERGLWGARTTVLIC